MAMSNEEYRENDIKSIPFVDLFAEYRERFKYGQALEQEMSEAYRAGEIGQMFALASELGVVSIQAQILNREVKRRGEEDAPLSPEEVSQVEAVLLEELINSLLQ